GRRTQNKPPLPHSFPPNPSNWRRCRRRLREPSWAEPPIVYDKPIYRFNAAGYLKPGYTHVFVVSAEGGTPRQITNGSFHFGGPGINASPATWSPDAKSLLVSANRHNDYESNPADTEAYDFGLADRSV